MKYSIFDAAFSEAKQESRGMSALYVKWELDRRGLTEYPIADSDVILVSMQSVDAIPALKTLRNRYKDKIIIVGGSASTTPYSVGLYSDCVCVGDGQRFLDVLFADGYAAATKLDNVWIHGETRRVSIDNNFPWSMPPIQAEDGAFRVWAGRGCKKKCKFCPTGWTFSYSENPSPNDLIIAANDLLSRGKRIAYLSNDLMQHSFSSRLPVVEHGSYSIDYMRKNGLPKARQIRLGVEGVSARLRSFVSKPISFTDLVGATAWLNENHKGVRWFMLAGLPTEAQPDWSELKDTLLDWKKKTTKGVLGVSFTAFIPHPGTPFATEAVNDDYWENYLDFKEWFFGGRGWSNRIKLMFPQQPQARVNKAMLTLGLSESEVREGGHVSPNERLLYPYQGQINKARERNGLPPLV